MMNAVPVPEAEVAWSLPDRGRVGMYGLIAAEAAIFTIFVVAYLFYVGKSLSGPLPNQVLHAPIDLTICLLSSSLTIHLAVAALRDARMPAVSTCCRCIGTSSTRSGSWCSPWCTSSGAEAM